MGCHGALNGLRVAQAFVAADPAACVLLCAVEMCSLHHQYGWNAEQVVANSLFADGAGAVVVMAGEGPSDALYQVVAAGSTVIPESEDAMSWRIGDHGFEMTLSARVPDLIASNLRAWLDGWLTAHGLTVAASRLVGRSSGRPAHPGGRRRSPRDRSPGTGDLSFGPGRIRQHVVADGSFHPRADARCKRPTPVGGPGVWAGPCGRGTFARVSSTERRSDPGASPPGYCSLCSTNRSRIVVPALSSTGSLAAGSDLYPSLFTASGSMKSAHVGLTDPGEFKAIVLSRFGRQSRTHRAGRAGPRLEGRGFGPDRHGVGRTFDGNHAEKSLAAPACSCPPRPPRLTIHNRISAGSHEIDRTVVARR